MAGYIPTHGYVAGMASWMAMFLYKVQLVFHFLPCEWVRV